MPALDIEGIFHAAREKPTGERAAFLRSACGDNAETVALLESLLISAEAAADFLESPAAEFMTTGARELDRGAWIGTVIGNYRIQRIIAAGGMGVVYEAEQAAPPRRVALKLLRRGLQSAAAVKRFRRESELLGRLRHDGIAQVYEAGVYHEGSEPTPFFAMEFLAGAVPLTEYARKKSLTVRETVTLLCRVCDAVQYCHDQGVIHRDLKPANILVTGSGEPKVIDFGVAQSQTTGPATQSWHTVGNPLIGSWPYMSPEQVSGDASAVDAQADVYALGVMAYELFAGRLPLDLTDLPPLEAARRIRDEEPPPLGEVDRQLRGDLEAITATAMAKEKERRYPSAAALAADLRRFLGHEPIQARRAGALYQAAKFVRRNRFLLSAAGLLVVALTLGLAGTASQALRATRARDRAVLAEQEQNRERERAEQARDEAEAVTEFLTETLASADPGKQGKDVTVREVLDHASEGLREKFSEQPLIEARLRYDIGWTYLRLGHLDKAQAHLAEAAAIYHRRKGARDPQTLRATYSLSVVLGDRGHFSEAEAQQRATLEVQRRVLGEEDFETLNSMNNLAVLYTEQGRYEQAEPLFVQVLETRKRIRGETHADTLVSMNSLAILYKHRGRYEQAEPLFVQCLDIRRRILGDEHPLTLASMNNLASHYYDQGRYAEAESLNVQTVEIRRRVLGLEHPDTLRSMSNLGGLYQRQGRYDQAEPLFVQVLDNRRRVLGAEHPDTLDSMNNLAALYSDQARYDQAEPLIAQAVEIQTRTRGPEHPDTLVFRSNLAVLLQDQGRYKEAEPIYLEVLEIRKRVLGAEHPLTLSLLDNLSDLYHDQGRFHEAEPLSTLAVTGAEKVLPPEHPDLATYRGTRGRILLRLGRLKEAEECLLGSCAVLGEAEGRRKETRELAQALVDLYEAWEATEPGHGYAAKAAEWRAAAGMTP